MGQGLNYDRHYCWGLEFDQKDNLDVGVSVGIKELKLDKNDIKIPPLNY